MTLVILPVIPWQGFKTLEEARKVAAMPKTGEAEHSRKTKVEILYFDGCPTYLRAERVLRKVLAEEGADADISLVAVNTAEEAGRLRFPGSPTIRVDDRDLFPDGIADREAWGLGCRMYPTPDGPKGSPTPEMLRDALSVRATQGA